MKKVMFIAFAVGLCLTANITAQVPSYVPTNGLVGWWPFNGNANDESGNGNNGTITGATLTTDRFGGMNNAYNFNGISNYIDVGNPSSLGNNPSNYTQAGWVYLVDFSDAYVFMSKRHDNTGNDWGTPVSTVNGTFIFFADDAFYTQAPLAETNQLSVNQWHHLTFVKNQNTYSIYVNGVLDGSITDNHIMGGTSNNLIFGAQLAWPEFFKGKLDDIGVWNRALTQQEITTLYNSCQGTNITSQPSNSSVNIGSSAQFSVGSTFGGSFQWQSNPSNFGWQNVPSNANYSGGTTSTLTVSNTSVSNHNQPFRAIVNAGGCIDTSDVAQIIIGDTCLTTVTDTLIINTTLSLPVPNNENTILIYPNPASDHITIDNGNFAAMAGYTIKIENNAGQQVFQSLINQAQFYVDLSTWSGNGLYFVHLIDPQNNTVTVRKIVLQ